MSAEWDGWACGLAVMISPLHGEDRGFNSLRAHFRIQAVFLSTEEVDYPNFHNRFAEQVVDTFYVKDMFGLKYYTESKQKALEKRLRAAIIDGVERAQT